MDQNPITITIADLNQDSLKDLVNKKIKKSKGIEIIRRAKGYIKASKLSASIKTDLSSKNYKYNRKEYCFILKYEIDKYKYAWITLEDNKYVFKDIPKALLSHFHPDNYEEGQLAEKEDDELFYHDSRYCPNKKKKEKSNINKAINKPETQLIKLETQTNINYGILFSEKHIETMNKLATLQQYPNIDDFILKNFNNELDLIKKMGSFIKLNGTSIFKPEN